MVNLTVRAVGSTVFDVEWLPPKEEKEQERKEEGTVNASAYYMLTYTARLVSEVRFTEGNNFTLTELNECTAYAIAVRRAYGIGENTQFGPASSSILITSRDSRKYRLISYGNIVTSFNTTIAATLTAVVAIARHIVNVEIKTNVLN